MAIAVKSCLDVVFWLSDQALNDREYIQPQKLHHLHLRLHNHQPSNYQRFVSSWSGTLR